MGARLPGIAGGTAYPIYLMAGNAAWGLFSEIFNRCITVFLVYAGSLKKISFPRLCLPVIVWGSALVNHALLLAAIFVVFAALGHLPAATWLALPGPHVLPHAVHPFHNHAVLVGHDPQNLAGLSLVGA